VDSTQLSLGFFSHCWSKELSMSKRYAKELNEQEIDPDDMADVLKAAAELP
jgi:hypothetical protein